MIFKFLEQQSVLILLMSIMAMTGILKDNGALNSLWAFLSKKMKSKKALFTTITAIGGVLPIPGRISATCALLDTLKKKEYTGNFGIAAYLATHHYYLWSPVEKSIIISLGMLGISYAAYLQIMWIPILVSILFSFGYIYFFVKEEDIPLKVKTNSKFERIHFFDITIFFLAFIFAMFGINPVITFGISALILIFRNKVKIKALYEYINFKLIGLIGLVVSCGFYLNQIIKVDLKAIFTSPEMGASILTASVIAVFLAFLLGSSSKYATISGLLSSIFGVWLFPIFYIMEYAGYIVSPTHKCVLISSSYFKTPVVQYYSVLIIYCIAMLIAAIIQVLLL